MIREFGRNLMGEPVRNRWRGYWVQGVLCRVDTRRGNGVDYFGNETMVKFAFDPTTTDCGPLVAYCEGHMPAYAFADWLEEQVSDFPPEGLAILRERAEGE